MQCQVPSTTSVVYASHGHIRRMCTSPRLFLLYLQTRQKPLSECPWDLQSVWVVVPSSVAQTGWVQVWVSSSHPCLWFWKGIVLGALLRGFPPINLQSELLVGRLVFLAGTGQKTSLLCSSCWAQETPSRSEAGVAGTRSPTRLSTACVLGVPLKVARSSHPLRTSWATGVGMEPRGPSCPARLLLGV